MCPLCDRLVNEHEKARFPDGSGLVQSLKTGKGLGERADSLGQAAELPRSRVLVHHAARNAACHFRLNRLQRGGGSVLVTSGEGGFHLLHQGADPADAGTIDCGATLVAADALLGLRRIGHLESSVLVNI